MSVASVRRIQAALEEQGFDPGPIDGIWGRRTIAAVRRFQAAAGLVADGIVGPITSAALFAQQQNEESAVITAPFMPWYQTAKQLVGTREIFGPGSNPVILDWADDLEMHYPDDDVPWCGLFVAHCIGSTLPDEVLPGNPLGARRWLGFGVETSPRLGAVMVFWRGSRSGWKGHVGFYAGEDKSAYQILGGNQSNRVSLAWIHKSRLLGARWPETAASIASGSIVKARGEGLSENEA
ncbi:MAG: TIGR02594 family protein [Bacteroidota bacterium]|nr:TIGR02594 family protein [Bacteroidota bacterium]